MVRMGPLERIAFQLFLEKYYEYHSSYKGKLEYRLKVNNPWMTVKPPLEERLKGIRKKLEKKNFKKRLADFNQPEKGFDWDGHREGDNN